MLEYKESLGYYKKLTKSYLKDFQRYFTDAGHDAFTENTVIPWCKKGRRKHRKVSAEGSPLCKSCRNTCMQWDMWEIHRPYGHFPLRTQGNAIYFYQHGTYQVLYRKRQETLLQNKPMPPSDHPCHLQADLLLRSASKARAGN